MNRETFHLSLAILGSFQLLFGTFLLGCQNNKQYLEGHSPINDSDTVNDSDTKDIVSSDGDTEAIPNSTDPVDTNPSDTDSEDTVPVDTDPADTNPVDTEEVDTNPLDTASLDTDPADAGIDETDSQDFETEDTEISEDSGTSTEDTETAPIDTDSADTETEDTEVLVDTDEHLDTEAVPLSVPEIHIEIDEVSQAALDADPFNGQDVLGAFVDETGKRYVVELNYRGAYALQNLINMGYVQRNWKVKFSKTDMYQNRREWNFNYEPDIRQKLAYDLLKFAGVKMPAPRHVRMFVNDEEHGIYLEYEDPDSKNWLWDRFGNDEGDLYKAAYDVPDEPRYFADLTYLGDTDEDYFYHYDKKTNNNTLPGDYSMLRGFIYDLNYISDEQFVDWMDQSFNWDQFIAYLAVSNFLSNWDGYPQRPKNFWLYNNPSTKKWTFIPWDVDNTFQTSLTNFNQMGTDASIFYQFDEYEPYELQEGEGTERPLVRRMMIHPEFRDAYVAKYKELISGILDEAYIANRASRLTDLLLSVASTADAASAAAAESEIQDFTSRRCENVMEQLSAY